MAQAAQGAQAAQAASQVPTSGPKPEGSPDSIALPWRTSKLAGRIAEKIHKREPLNVVCSYMGSGLPLFSEQQLNGFRAGCATAAGTYPVDRSAIAPVQPDAGQQVTQIQAKLAMTAVDVRARGIPVSAVGLPTHGHELTCFTQVPLKDGAAAAGVVLDRVKANARDLKIFAASDGDPPQTWARGA